MAIEKGVKLLTLDLCFKLPMDFKGDLNDAIQAMLDYRRGKKDHDKVFTAVPEASSYDNWWDMVTTTNRPLFAKASLSEYDGENFNTLPLNKNISDEK